MFAQSLPDSELSLSRSCVFLLIVRWALSIPGVSTKFEKGFAPHPGFPLSLPPFLVSLSHPSCCPNMPSDEEAPPVQSTGLNWNRALSQLLVSFLLPCFHLYYAP